MRSLILITVFLFLLSCSYNTKYSHPWLTISPKDFDKIGEMHKWSPVPFNNYALVSEQTRYKAIQKLNGNKIARIESSNEKYFLSKVIQFKKYTFLIRALKCTTTVKSIYLRQRVNISALLVSDVVYGDCTNGKPLETAIVVSLNYIPKDLFIIFPPAG